MRHLSLAIAAAALLFAGCSKKDDTIFNAKFYSLTSGQDYDLYLNGSYQGRIHYAAATPDCEQATTDANDPLVMQLPSGKYDVMGKNAQGEPVSTFTMSFSKTGARMTSNPCGGSNAHAGGGRISTDGTCLTVGLY